MIRLADFPRASLITCILSDDGQDIELIRSLRNEWGLITANTFQCRGFGLQLRSKYKRRHQGAVHSVRVVSLVVAEERADALFEYIYRKVNFSQSCPGLVYQGSLLAASPYSLPPEILDEDRAR